MSEPLVRGNKPQDGIVLYEALPCAVEYLQAEWSLTAGSRHHGPNGLPDKTALARATRGSGNGPWLKVYALIVFLGSQDFPSVEHSTVSCPSARLVLNTAGRSR